MKHKITLLIIFGIFFKVFAQKHERSLKSNLENLVNYSKLDTIIWKKEIGSISYYDEGRGENAVLDIKTIKQPSFIYNLSEAIPIKTKAFKKGQVFLLTFESKSLKSGLETGEAKVNWQLRQAKSHRDDLKFTNSLMPKWQTYYVPFKATTDISPENFALVLQFGFRPQEFLIKNIRFLAYPEGTDINTLPKTKVTYKGMEKDAEWRQKALKRIDKVRKTDFTIQFKINGKPVSNADVKIELIKHDFDFGATISSKDVVNNTLAYQKLKEYFNICVFENDLKIRQWQQPKRRQMTLKAIDVLKNDGIKVKGHVLIWPGFRYMPKKIKKNQDNPELVKKVILNHVRSILRKTRGKIDIWDVVNEAYTNQDLQSITGSEKILYQGFRITKKTQPQAKRFINEYGIISRGGINKKKQEWYYKFIKRVDKRTGGLVDGIGIQSHIGNDLTPPEKVLEILDYYAKLDKEIGISEFTLDVKDPELREQYTRDFMIAAFSHPNVSQFIFWGMLKNTKEKVDLFNQDGTPGAMGRAYLYLVKNLWTTKIEDQTDRRGRVKFRGFNGVYKYEVKIKDKTYRGLLYLNKDNTNVDINLY